MSVELLVDALAVYRLTRLVTADTITQPLRETAIEVAYQRAGRSVQPHEPDEPDAWQLTVEADADPPKLATLITCRWCAGMWVALGAVALRAVAPRAWRPLARALAFSAVAALMAGLEDD